MKKSYNKSGSSGKYNLLCITYFLQRKVIMEGMSDQERKEFLSIRTEVGRTLDPYTAEVCWDYIYVTDPYGLYPDLPEEYQQVGRKYFARSPGSDIWVCFCDIPKPIRDALWEMHERTLSFPAGLSEMIKPATTRPTADEFRACFDLLSDRDLREVFAIRLDTEIRVTGSADPSRRFPNLSEVTRSEMLDYIAEGDIIGNVPNF
jgi:hypothetical protein